MNKSFKLAALASALLLAHAAQANQQTPLLAGAVDPTTGNTTAASNWRFAPGQTIGGVAGALDGVARLSFTTPAGNYACSGSLLAGGQYVLTAAHCADDFSAMTVQFGWYAGSALVTRSVAVSDAYVHPLWTGELDTGADIAILKLNAPVTTIQGYSLSTTIDTGKTHLMAGYGTTQLASSNSATNWSDGNYGHYGWNVFDVTSVEFNTTIFPDDPVYGDPAYYAPGLTYMVDFDRTGDATGATWNVLGRLAADYGGSWTSDQGLGADEALIAGGDSGGGDFIFDAANNRFLLSAVHSWGWNNPCGYMGLSGCNALGGNSSSYGDLSGSTAVYSHLAWINSITGAVPEPETYALMFAGLALVGSVARRRKQAA